MDVRVELPDWMEHGSIRVRLTELNPQSIEALIENLRDLAEQDDDRVRLLLRLWDALTADE